jgi:hypothetical protein
VYLFIVDVLGEVMQEQIFIMSPLKAVAKLNRAIASTSMTEPQQDCLYMKSVLVSTGQNKNDDIFLPEEMWKAKSSPEKKPVNWEHNTGYEIIDSPEGDGKRVVADNQIIGVMDSSYPANKDGSPINTEAALAEDFEIPQDFDIITEAVIWKYLFPKTSAKLINEASANRIFVSMEAWFNKFDYRVGSKIVARNEQTAFLDRHLRSNGGDGSFEGQKVGRVLRNIVFGGVGIVANPANEDSVIHSFTNADLKGASTVTNGAIASNTIGQLGSNIFKESQEVCDNMANSNELNTSANTQVNITSEDYKQVVQRLVKAEHTIETKDAELAQANAEIEALKLNADNTKSAFVKGSDALAGVLGDVSAHKVSKANAENFFKVLVDEISDKLGQTDQISAELEEAKAKLDELENEKRLASRSNRIRDSLGLGSDDSERLEKLAASTDSLNDESFDSWLENTKELFISAQEDAKDDKKKKEEEDKKKNPFAKSASDEDGITDTRVLDNVVATAGAPAGVDNAAAPVSLPEKMQTLATALWGANKRDTSQGGK